MTTMSVDDGLYGALEAAASRDGRPVEALVHEAFFAVSSALSPTNARAR